MDEIRKRSMFSTWSKCFHQIGKSVPPAGRLNTEVSGVHARQHNFPYLGTCDFIRGFHNVDNTVAAARSRASRIVQNEQE